MKPKKTFVGVLLGIVIVLALGVYANYLFPFVLQSFSAQPIATGVQAPPFELKSLDGETISLAQFKGKPVALKFWSSI